MAKLAIFTSKQKKSPAKYFFGYVGSFQQFLITFASLVTYP